MQYQDAQSLTIELLRINTTYNTLLTVSTSIPHVLVRALDRVIQFTVICTDHKLSWLSQREHEGKGAAIASVFTVAVESEQYITTR